MKNIYCDFSPRHSGKTSRLTKIAEEHGGFYLFSWRNYSTKVISHRRSNGVTWLSLNNNVMISDYMRGQYIGNVYIDKGPEQEDLSMELFLQIMSNPRVNDIYIAVESLQSFNPEIQKYIKEHYPEYVI
jgi:hypothetical protein